MRSLAEVISQADLQSQSLSAVTQKFGNDSLRACIAKREMFDLYRRTGGKFGPLGPVSGDLQEAPDRSFRQDHLLGDIHLQDIDKDPTARQTKMATITLAGIRCFAAQDVDTDELFGTVSLININPNFTAVEELVKTVPLPLVDAATGDMLYKETVLGNVPLTGSSVVIHTALWDNESGNVDEIREKVEAVLREGTKKAASAVAAAAIANDPSVTGGTFGEVTEWEIGGVKPFHVLTVKLADVIAHWLADDLLGERHNLVPAENILDFEGDGYRNSLRTEPGLEDEFDFRFNWPPPSHDIAFKKGGALYKAYFKIQAFQQIVPIGPRL